MTRSRDLAPLMAASDLLITKPGGLVCSEALGSRPSDAFHFADPPPGNP